MPIAVPPEMPRLSAGGFSAYVNTFAFAENAVYGQQEIVLYFLSLLGPQQSVRALWARLLKNELVSLAWDDAHCTKMGRLAPLGPKQWRMHSASLPSAAAHQLVLVPSLALAASDGDQFLILPRREDEAAALHYRFLNRRIDLPLHPSWDGWLWARARREGEAEPLSARGLLAFQCAPDVAALTRDVSQAVRERRLTLPVDAQGLESRRAA